MTFEEAMQRYPGLYTEADRGQFEQASSVQAAQNAQAQAAEQAALAARAQQFQQSALGQSLASSGLGGAFDMTGGAPAAPQPPATSTPSFSGGPTAQLAPSATPTPQLAPPPANNPSFMTGGNMGQQGAQRPQPQMPPWMGGGGWQSGGNMGQSTQGGFRGGSFMPPSFGFQGQQSPFGYGGGWGGQSGGNMAGRPMGSAQQQLQYGFQRPMQQSPYNGGGWAAQMGERSMNMGPAQQQLRYGGGWGGNQAPAVSPMPQNSLFTGGNWQQPSPQPPSMGGGFGGQSGGQSTGGGGFMAGGNMFQPPKMENALTGSPGLSGLGSGPQIMNQPPTMERSAQQTLGAPMENMNNRGWGLSRGYFGR